MRRDPYLEVTYRKGKPVAAYLRVARARRGAVVRTARVRDGLIVDYDADDVVLGVEITAPAAVTAASLRAALERLGIDGVGVDDLAPLLAA